MKVKIVAEYFAINKQGKDYGFGEEVEINDVTAAELIASGRVEKVEAKSPKKEKEEDK